MSPLNFILVDISLCSLQHPNIVKYKGFVKTPEYLYIILEYAGPQPTAYARPFPDACQVLRERLFT